MSISDSWFDHSQADAAAAWSAGTRYIDDRLWFCADSGYCPAFVGNTPMFYDANHITKAYGQMVVPQLEAAPGL